MKLTFVNVGYGEAILIRVPDSSHPGGEFVMAIDGGGCDETEFTGNRTGRIRFADYIRQSSVDHIDLLVNSHIHEDHTSGLLPVVQMLPVGAFWQGLTGTVRQVLPPLDPAIAGTVTGGKYIQSINDFRRICECLPGRVKQISAGQCVEPAAGLRIRVLAPDQKKTELLNGLMKEIADAASDDRLLQKACRHADAAMNNLSAILLLEYAGRKVLLPGDTNRDGFEGIEELEADIFKVGHHGQKDGISRQLFRKIHPAHTVCCASSDRRYESAAPEILKMMAEEGSKLWFSDCPPVPAGIRGADPHSALTFRISDSGEIAVDYE